jgi:hypothetical protein
VADSEAKQMTSFMIEPSLLARVDQRARDEDRSRSWILREFVRAGLGPDRTPWSPATPHRPGDPLPDGLPGDYVRGPVEEGA